MSSTGIVEAIEQVRKRTGDAPDLFSFCLGGTLAAIALAWLAAKGRADEVNSATLIGALVDFSDMRDWSAFVHEGHLGALEDHLEAQGFADSLELQRLFAAMRANDLIWSSVVNHYLLDQPAPPSDLLYWFEDGARIPAAFLKSYNRELLLENKLKEPAGFMVGDVADRPRRDHDADAGHRAQGRSRLGVGSGLSAARATSAPTSSSAARATMPGVINPPAANKHGYWTNAEQPAEREGVARHARRGTKAAGGRGGPMARPSMAAARQVAARKPKDPIEPAPGRYAMMP